MSQGVTRSDAALEELEVGAPTMEAPTDTRGWVGLTFDAEHPDRPNASEKGHYEILEILRAASVKATFFLQGSWVTAYPDAAAAVASEGHLVGNHSLHHAHMSMLSLKGIRADILGAEQIITHVTGANPRPWFRCPFGDGSHSYRVHIALRSTGYRHVGWQVNGRDWDSTGSDLTRTVVSGVLAAPLGAVVLLHTWPQSTTKGLPRIIEQLQSEGRRFMRLDEMPQEALPRTRAR